MAPIDETLGSASQAAAFVLRQAMKAAAQGTFAVGGCIVDNNSGRIIQAMHNNVLKPLDNTTKVFTYDPTAHGERQLVYWYYANKARLNLPAPQDLTIVTNLDPCVMCTGTLLTAGFNVAVVAIDDFAGINYDSTFTFTSLPPSLRALAKSKFGYYACGNSAQDPSIYVRTYIGGPRVKFKESTVDAMFLAGCATIFQASVNTVRNNSSDSGLDPSQLANPSHLPDNSPIKAKFREAYPQAFTFSVPMGRLPDQELYNILTRVKDSTPNAKNAVALLDPFGNLVLCFADTFEQSPVHTAFMNLTQAYAMIRYGLMNSNETREEATKTLTHPKFGTFVFLNAPDPADSTTVMMLGAYGSTMEGPVPQVFPANFQFYNPPQEGTLEELYTVISTLPPFYTQLAQLSVMQTAAGRPY